MLGWINDCIERLVIHRLGVDAWRTVKQKAGCQDIPDGGFYKMEHYSDKSTIDLVNAAGELMGLTPDEVFEAFGEFFVHYIREEGYDSLLCCQGSTLKDWMSNINAIHQHLQTTFPKKMIMPEFWCEDCSSGDGGLILHYHSQRGSYLAPLAKGLVVEVARYQFDIDVEMDRLQTQGQKESNVTSWKVTTKNPKDQWKLAKKVGERNGVRNMPTSFKCPFTGMTGRRSGNFTSVMPRRASTGNGKHVRIRKAYSGSNLRRLTLENSDSSNDAANTRSSMSDARRERSGSGKQIGSSPDLFGLGRARPITRANFSNNGVLDGAAGSNGGYKNFTFQPRITGTTCPRAKAPGTQGGASKPLSDESLKRLMSDVVRPGSKNNLCIEENCEDSSEASNEDESYDSDRDVPPESNLSETDTSEPGSPGGCPYAKPMCSSPTGGSSVASRGSDFSLFSARSRILDDNSSDDSEDEDGIGEHGLSGAVVKTLHPYHVMLNRDFKIVQVGKSLPGVLHQVESDIVGQHISHALKVSKPMSMSWSWKWLRMIEDQSFVIVPTNVHHPSMNRLRFKTTVLHVSEFPPRVMLMMTPDANNLTELRDMNLTLSDLPVHGAQRDAVFLREHLCSQMNNALKMEKLSKSLVREKELLERMLPSHAAEGLRQGKTVEPMLHNNVTLFFSDVCNFTTICKGLYPWQVIDMINNLYLVMDLIALKFNLFKIEIIGDAYICCSGLPKPDKDHAKNVANFAIAVTHCCKQVLSPLDEKPLELRIGIHTGSCASGIVGSAVPRYTVFGDTVNTTSRFESTGKPGMIHCSHETKEALEEHDGFHVTPRGLVSMKGKGDLMTYWVTANNETNPLVNQSALAKLDEEVKLLLKKRSFQKRQAERRKASMDMGGSGIISSSLPTIPPGAFDIMRAMPNEPVVSYGHGVVGPLP